MSLRRIFPVVLCLAWNLAISVHPVHAQPVAERLSAKERAIEQRLRQPITLNLKDAPLEQAMKDLTLSLGVQIIPDTEALKEGNVALDSPLTLAVDNIDLNYALKLMLNPLRLTYVVEKGGLKITTQESERRKLIKVTYNVADLVEATSLVSGKVKDGERTIGEALKELVQNTVARDSWERVGGRGNIQYFPHKKALVVTQTSEAQEETQLLLTTLQKLYELSVAVDVRFVQASPAVAKRWWKDVDQAGKSVDVTDASKSRDLVSIDDGQLFMLLEAVQGDRKSVITQGPKLTLLNGQRGTVEISTTGWSADLKPVVTPDRKAVRLTLNVEHRLTDKARSIERITKAAKTCSLPDGRTLVWNLGTDAEREHLFVLVTPRIRERVAIPEVLSIQKAIERAMTPGQ